MLKLRRCPSLWQGWQFRKQYSSAADGPAGVDILTEGTLSAFRVAFQHATPVLLPRGHFSSLPAVHKWFSPVSEHLNDSAFNVSYLTRFGEAVVPLEITHEERFVQVDQTFQSFLEASTSTSTSARIYLAQASLADLPEAMREDVPTPDIILKAGKGDIYSTSIWMGRAPTYTPLHRDPNPNLFVQLAGRKTVRLFNPHLGSAIFHDVQTQIGGHASATMRGVEMMEGEERTVLEQAVWGATENTPWPSRGLECDLGPGDALFIPKGFWHSIKGIGEGITGSVNWWFR